MRKQGSIISYEAQSIVTLLHLAVFVCVCVCVCVCCV